jgi:predicted Zn-dependent peptidase
MKILGKMLRLFYYTPQALAVFFFLSAAFAQEGDLRAPLPLADPARKSDLRKRMEALSLPEIAWKIPVAGQDVERLRMGNGITLFLKEDPRLPLVQIDFLLRTGKIYEPIEKDGLAYLTGFVMRTGGTEALDPTEFDRTLDFMGASLEFSIGLEAASGSLNIKPEDLDTGLKLTADMLRRPRFDPARLELAKLQIKEAIRRRDDSPDAVVSRVFQRAIYGFHPYGRVLEWRSVEAHQREDLVAFHQKHFHPNHLFIAVAGDFQRDSLLQKLHDFLGDWAEKKVTFPEAPQAQDGRGRRVLFIPRATNQSRILFGHLGIDRTNPDAAAIQVLNMILGGGFTSRITKRIRSNEGLAYSAGTSFAVNTLHRSSFQARMETKTETTVDTLRFALEEMQRIRDEMVSDEELRGAKETLENRLIFQFADPWIAVRLLMQIEYDERPRDFYQRYLDQLRSVKVADVQRVARKYLQPEDLILVVLGDAKAFGRSLSEFGAVEEIRLANPLGEIPSR